MYTGLLSATKRILWATNGLIILLNNAIYPKPLFLKDFLSAALEIQRCSGISKPLVLLSRRNNSLFSGLFFDGGMLVFSTTILLLWPWTIVVFFVVRCLSTFWKWHNIKLRLRKLSLHAENLKTGVLLEDCLLDYLIKQNIEVTVFVTENCVQYFLKWLCT